MHHFLNDANVRNFDSCVKPIYKQVTYDQKKLLNWMKTNKMSFSVGKAEFLHFTSLKKQLDSDLRISLNGKKPYEKDSFDSISTKLSKSNH